MTRSEPVTSAKREEILAFRRDHPSLGLRQLARIFRLPESTIAAIFGHPADARPREAASKPPVPPEKLNPLTVAKQMLPSLDLETLRYDGRIRSLDEIMRLTNTQRILWGLPQVGYNPAWLVKVPPATELPPRYAEGLEPRITARPRRST